MSASGKLTTRAGEPPIIADGPVLLFLASAYGRMCPADAIDLCRAHFGEERTPLRSTVSRLWKRLDASVALQTRLVGKAGARSGEVVEPNRPRQPLFDEDDLAALARSAQPARPALLPPLPSHQDPVAP